jgi:hypothetical protein
LTNLFAIANDNDVYILWVAPLIYVIFYPILILDIQEAAFRSPEKPRVVLDSFSFSWGVYD